MGTKRVGWARIKSLINENQNQLHHRKQGYMAVNSDTTLTAADSGKIILMSNKGVDITLPDPEAGMTFTIIQVKDHSTTDSTVDAGTNVMGGSVAGVAADANNLADGSSDTTCTFGSDTLAGDQITLVSDGTKWYVSGIGAAGGTNGITFS